MRHRLEDVNAEIKNYIKTTDKFAVTVINNRTYAVKTPPTNLSSLDFVHVTRKGTSPIFVCAFGSNCGRTAVKVAKKTTRATLCVHEHLVQMVENTKNPPKPVDKPDDDLKQSAPIPEDVDNQDVWLTNTARYLFENFRMDLSYGNMRSIEHEIMEIESSENGFPVLYQVSFIFQNITNLDFSLHHLAHTGF